MSLTLFRRRPPAPITTSTAPPRAAGIDVTPSAQRLGADGEARPAAELPPGETWRGSVHRSLSTPPAHTSLPIGPPSWRPGTCYHPGHIVLADGFRYGVLPDPGQDPPSHASLLRCAHVNVDGC